MTLFLFSKNKNFIYKLVITFYMTYKHKVRVSHILDDMDRGHIKSKEEFKEVLEQIDKETFIEHFLEEYDQSNESEEDGDLNEFK